MDRKERRERHIKKQIPEGVEKYQWMNRFTDEETDTILEIIERYAAFTSTNHIEKNDAFNMLCEKGLTKDEAKFEIETAR